MKAVWICGTNPAVSMPDAERARAALRNAELVIAQDAYHPTETTALAHVVLPAAQWPEKAGTTVNSERRITLMRAAIDPPGEARADWQIFAAARAADGLRRVRLGSRGRGLRRVRGADRRAPVRSVRRLARAARPRGHDPVAVPVESRTPGPRACTPTAASTRRTGGRVSTPALPGDPADPPDDDLPARPHHRPDREPVAHDDAHGQVVGADGGGARAVHRAAPRRRRARLGRRPRTGRLAAGNGRSQGAAGRDAARGHGLRAVPLGRAARARPARAASTTSRTARPTRSPASRA